MCQALKYVFNSVVSFYPTVVKTDFFLFWQISNSPKKEQHPYKFKSSEFQHESQLTEYLRVFHKGFFFELSINSKLYSAFSFFHTHSLFVILSQYSCRKITKFSLCSYIILKSTRKHLKNTRWSQWIEESKQIVIFMETGKRGKRSSPTQQKILIRKEKKNILIEKRNIEVYLLNIESHTGLWIDNCFFLLFRKEVFDIFAWE